MNSFKALDPPTTCANCGQLLPVVNRNIHAWHASDGNLYCNSYCAADADEAAWVAQTRATRRTA